MNPNFEELEKELEQYPGQWFVINSNTGHEDKVRNDLLQKIKSQKLENLIFDVRITKYNTETPKGKPTEKNKFPGYIFINMKMTEQAWFIVRNTPGVTGFIGSSGRGAKPFPLTSTEVARIIFGLQEQQPVDETVETTNVETGVKSYDKKITSGPNATEEKVQYTADFEVGELVTILEGPFADKEGKVISMDYDKGIAVVTIEMFGRYTPAEVEFANAKPVKEY